jgi:hypothetical protein
MSAFDALLGRGFGVIVAATSAPTISHAGVTRSGVATPIIASKELKDQGYWPKFACVFELTRADFEALKLGDRTVVIFKADPTRHLSLSLKVIGIENDGADPCVKVTLEEQPK